MFACRELCRLFVISIWVLLTCSLSPMLTGCQSARRCTTALSPNVHIAYGHLGTNACPRSSGLVRYELDEVQRGTFLVNDYIYVSFYHSSIPEHGLPQKAIMVLEHPFFRDGTICLPRLASAIAREDAVRMYDALGGDAYRGLLPDTAENRKSIASVPLSALAENPGDMRISERVAITIAEREVRRRGDLSEGEATRPIARRYNYGWMVFLDIIRQDGAQVVGRHKTVIVGDDQHVKEYQHGE